jgi:hypothetical protein
MPPPKVTLGKFANSTHTSSLARDTENCSVLPVRNKFLTHQGNPDNVIQIVAANVYRVCAKSLISWTFSYSERFRIINLSARK